MESSHAAQHQTSLGPHLQHVSVELVAMKAYIKVCLANGFIRSSQSPAAALVMFVKRPDGKLRLVVDYRGLNALTIKNRFPLCKEDSL